MKTSLLIRSVHAKNTQIEQIAFLYRSCLSRLPNEQDRNRCTAALAQGLEISDILWALLNSREFIFIQ
jgi:hypothetical protein